MKRLKKTLATVVIIVLAMILLEGCSYLNKGFTIATDDSSLECKQVTEGLLCSGNFKNLKCDYLFDTTGKVLKSVSCGFKHE